MAGAGLWACLAFAVIALAPCAALYACRGLKAEQTLPFSMGAQALILLAIGYAAPFSWGVYALAALSALLWIVFLAKAGDIRRMAGFFNLPCVAFAAVLPVLYYACCNRLYLSYDEYSHWGLVIKLIAACDELPRAGAGAAYLLYDYPPMSALWPSLICTIFGYREGFTYFGYTAFLWGLMIGLIPSAQKGAKQALSLLLCTCCLLMIFPFAVLRLFSEPMIALLFALLAVDEEETGRFFQARACVLAACLALTKNSAPVFVLMALVVRAAGRKRGMRRCVKPIAAAALAFASWAVYCNAQGITSAYRPEAGERLSALLGGTLDPAFASVPGRFAGALLTRTFPQAGVYSCYALGISPALLFVLLAALCLLAAVFSGDRRRARRMWAGMAAVQAAYIATVMLTYMFFFTRDEALRLGEFDRYLSLPALMVGLSACAVMAREAAGAWRTGVLCLLAAGGLALCHPGLMYETFVTRSTVQDTVWANYDTKRLAGFLRDALEDFPQSKVLVMGECSGIALRFEMAPDALVDAQGESWSGFRTADDAREIETAILEGGYTHVLCQGGAVPDELRGPLLGENAPFTVCSVERTEDGRLLLRPLAVMTDGE